MATHSNALVYAELYLARWVSELVNDHVELVFVLLELLLKLLRLALVVPQSLFDVI